MSLELTVNTIGAEQALGMILAGADNLNLHKEEINKLNVFPVPDGDTGTNMAMTMKSAANFASEVADPSLEQYFAKAAFGAVMGARGNSGVILSQILTGISSAFARCEQVDAKLLVDGFNAGSQSAYKAVSNPMEGTILTVVREAGEALASGYHDGMDIIECLKLYIDAGYTSLKKTPELLPVLKQAGVVDAGGAGYLRVVEGMLYFLQGKEIEQIAEEQAIEGSLNEQFDHVFTSLADIVYPYCTEFLIHTEKSDVSDDIVALKGNINDLGDCMLVVGVGNVIKVHIHTDNLSAVIGHASALGELDDIKINNMRAQNRALIEKNKNQAEEDDQEYKDAILVVCNGDGFSEIFKGLGATHIISGGQTMNPSTQDFLDAIGKIKAENFYILPNNKNIIMTAQQAADLSEGGNVHVVPSKTFPQGVSALMGYMPDMEVEETLEAMKDGITNVQSGEITQAVRDTTIDEVEIHENEYMSIVDGKIISSTGELDDAVFALIESATQNGAELVALYYGEDVTFEMANALLEELEEKFEDVEFEMYDGGQSVYHYIISAE